MKKYTVSDFEKKIKVSLSRFRCGYISGCPVIWQKGAENWVRRKFAFRDKHITQLKDTCEEYRKQAVEAMFIIRRIRQMCEGESKVDTSLILKELLNEDNQNRD